MTQSFKAIINQHCRPLQPVPTKEQPLLRELDGVRVVMFDIYGTLLMSASGDITTGPAVGQGVAFVNGLSAVGVRFGGDPDVGAQLLLDEIAAEHERARLVGVDYPEVEIVEVWRRTVAKLVTDGLVQRAPGAISGGSEDRSFLRDGDLRQLALEYEVRVNPVWPMPHARQCLENLCDRGLLLGVISNAQFLTIELCRALLPETPGGFAFDRELQYYSYQHGRAKPGRYLYERASKALARRGIRAHEVAYVGNDMLNDITPAHHVGFRTALFAGDARSLRTRDNDRRIAGVTPDIVITELSQLLKCL